MDSRIAALSNQAPIVIEAYPRHAASLLFADGGRLLLTTGMEPIVRLWDTRDWRLAGEIRGHTNAVTSVTLTHDESRLITTSSDKTTRIYSFPDGAPLQTLSGHTKTVTDAAFSPDATLLATASNDGRVLLYDMPSGALRATLKGHVRNVTSVSFSPDGTLLASSGLGQEALIWRMPDGKWLQALSGHDTVTGLVGWDADSRHIVTYDYAGAVRRFRAENADCLVDVALEIPAISALRPSPDGALLAAVAPHTLAFFDAHSFERLETINLKVKGVYGVAWSPAGDMIACSAADGRIRIWMLVPN